MRFFILSALCTTIEGLALGQLLESDNTADVKPFDYDGARQSLELTNPGLAEIAGAPGGFWGCWLIQWKGGCHWWPPHDGCQNVAFENDEHTAVSVVASFGPDQGSNCIVYAETGCDAKSKFWPLGLKETFDETYIFSYPGTANPGGLGNAGSFNCWVP